jgi:hypothetical protein
VRRLFQAIKRLSQAEYHLPRSLWPGIVISAPRDQTKVSLRRVHIDLFLQVNSQETRADVQLIDLEIVLGGDCECQPIMAQEYSQYIHSLAVDVFDLVISSAD